MTLLAPWAWWFMLAGGAVVALYLLKIKRRTAHVPSLEFWRALAGETKVHSLWQQLKRWLSMLLWVLIATALVLALGNPLLSAGDIKPRAIAVIIDNSASMQALEPEAKETDATRLSLARAALRELTTRRPVTDQWLVIEAAREPRVVQAWTLDPGAARRSIDALKPFAGSADLAGAVDLAGQLLEGKAEPTIVVISDGASGSIEPLTAKHANLVYWPVGKTNDNLGVSRLAVRVDRARGNYQALLAVANASDSEIEAPVTIQIDGSTTSVELAKVAPHSVWEKVVTIDPPDHVVQSGGVLRAWIERPDVLAADNEAFAVLEAVRPAVVWLVSPSESSFFFEQALASMTPLVWAEESLTMSLDRYEQAAVLLAALPAGARGPGASSTAAPGAGASETPPSITPPELIVFNGVAPKTLPARGNFVFVGAWPTALPATVTGELAQPQLFLSPRPHPLTQYLTLQGARLQKARRVALRDGQPARVLAQTDEGDPLIFVVEQPGLQALCVAFDVLDSDLPFRNAFPLLLRNAVAHMQAQGPGWLRSSYALGEAITPRRALPPNVTTVGVTDLSEPKPLERPLAVQNARFALPALERAGAVRVNIAGETVLAAVTLSDERESRLEVTPANADPRTRLELSGRLFSSMPWVALATIALLVIAIEWFTYHRRWTE